MTHLRIALVAVAVVLSPRIDLARSPDQLAPTPHPVLPKEASALWLVPSERDRSARTTAVYKPLADGVKRYIDGDYADALALVSRPSLDATPLGDYADYYKGLAQWRLEQIPEARRTLKAIRDRKPAGAIAITAALAEGEAAESAGDHRAAAAIYERLAADSVAVSEDVLSRLGRAALAAGDRRTAAEAYVRVYYEYALTDAATTAASHLATLEDQLVRKGYKADLGRASMLYGARRYAEARSAYQDFQPQTSGDDRELVDLRIAESDFFLKRYAAARDALTPYLENASRKAEARFFYLSALRELGRRDEYVALTRKLVEDFPDSSWSEEALNNLATHYILTDDDAAAAATFAELYAKFPSGSRAERAAWKAGWWSYRSGDFASAVKYFENAAETFPRSDYRPSFIYWAGRSHAKLGAGNAADSRLRLVYTDYGNSYYGRLAERLLERRAGARPASDRALPASNQAPAAEVPRPPTEDLIRLLLANGLYDDALAELRYAQRKWGTNPVIEATMAWAYNQKGELRRAITMMRRAYPQHRTALGQQLPLELQQVIFPLAYWNLIKKHSAARGLDPYLVAALVGQESTFDPKIRSVANAWGLMQILPSTGRRLARTLGIRRFNTTMLTDAETNVRLGTLYFSQLIKQFGGAHFALASYNAGENRVVRWKAERPDMDQDEFIDDIPFPETQNYVKRILGTAEDYRWLYGEAGGRPRPLVADAGSERGPAGTRSSSSLKKAAPARAKPSSKPAKKPAAKAAPKKKG
jgi:soluble lytic murein transglycosylase